MSKKTETIEIRVSPELKERVGSLSGERGVSTSRLVRQLLQDEISAGASEETATRSRVMTSPSRRAVTLGLSGLALMALAVGWNLATQGQVSARADVRVAFAEIDLDNDGVITRQEHAEFMKMIDVQEALPDGKLPVACEADLDDAMDDPFGNFAGIDADDNGEIVYTELLNAFIRTHTEAFQRYDMDGDGFLNRNEFTAGLAGEGMDLGKECDEALMAVALMDDEPGFHEEVRVAFTTLDENRDRKITLPEFLNNQPPFGLKF